MRHIMAIALTAAVSLGLVQSASAADIARPIYKAPVVAAPAFSWTGCYIGAHAGYGWGNKTWTDPALGPFANFDVDGGIFGGQIGCDYQAGVWVFGVEGQGSWVDIKATGQDLLTPGGYRHTAEADSLWSVTGRLGVTWDRSLFYVKGGAAALHDKYASFDVFRNGYYAQFSDTRWGWTIGGGWEYAFAPNWSWKIEYMYVDMGTVMYYTPDLLSPVLAFVPDRIDQDLHTIKFGINYRFGDYGKAPAVGRY